MKTKFTKSLIGMAAALSLLAMSSMQVKSQIFAVGDKDVNFGIGLGSPYLLGKTSIPPISVSFDYGFKDDIGPGVLGIGGYLGYTSSKYKYTSIGGEYGWKYTEIMVGARGTYHLELMDDLDTYGGILIGIRVRSAKTYGDWGFITGTSDDGLFLSPGLFVGGKYFFSDNLAVFGELGYSIAWLTVGVTLKLQ